MGVADTIIGICGNIAALVLFLVPAKTFNTIRKKKSTLDFSGIPYVTTLLNCLLWVLYGLPVNKGNVLVMTINSSGIVIQTVYILLFLYYASKILGIFVFDIVATAALGAGVILGVHSKATRITILGISCVVLNIGMYYAPLSVMWLVIKTKSNEYMPFLLSLMVLINSSFWTIYAFLLMDIYIIIPNTLGLAGGIFQMILYFCYRKPAQQVEGDARSTSKADVEIGRMEQKQNSTRTF
ncbi:hypothetical protein SELMODRAFT_136865 [Selaginella moellendorffii]|uniref:Bidirectional sugar transporter SWEET n=1 Tax=Selaginella moellendorffii TaxID=88036 RepID=D8TCK3_SELML|nr:hypothetical protein SELMODRAFT_136865 [Selaginella moellendorffii]